MAAQKKKKKWRLRRRHVLLVCIVAYLLYAFGSQYIKLRELNQQYALLVSEKQQLLVQEKFLRAQYEYMQSNAFVELTARKELGLVKPGEHVILSGKAANVPVLKQKPAAGEILH